MSNLIQFADKSSLIDWLDEIQATDEVIKTIDALAHEWLNFAHATGDALININRDGCSDFRNIEEIHGYSDALLLELGDLFFARIASFRRDGLAPVVILIETTTGKTAVWCHGERK